MGLSSKQEELLLALLWDSLKVTHRRADRRKTGWGDKSEIGLLACIENILEETGNATGLNNKGAENGY